jgi:hypothetical protein
MEATGRDQYGYLTSGEFWIEVRPDGASC